jgi:hypothetical protein
LGAAAARGWGRGVCVRWRNPSRTPARAHILCVGGFYHFLSESCNYSDALRGYSCGGFRLEAPSWMSRGSLGILWHISARDA